MTNMTNVVKTIRNEKQTRNVKIINRGAPVTQNFADEIGGGWLFDGCQPGGSMVNSLMQR
jgi:methanogenic corrinoid protein MtbC1